MYLHKRVCDIITLRRMFEIVYLQNFVSSTVIKQMIHLIFFFIIRCLFKNAIFIVKNRMIRLSLELQSINNFHVTSYWQVHCDHIFTKNLSWRIFRAININLIVSTYHFVLSSTPSYELELLILSCSKTSHVVIFMWYHSQHFLIRLGPAPL